jgi:hypothetical protein
MAKRESETGTLEGIAAILTETPKKAYDADYSHLKPSYRRLRKIAVVEDEPLDYDPSSDGAFIDDLHECYN